MNARSKFRAPPAGTVICGVISQPYLDIPYMFILAWLSNTPLLEPNTHCVVVVNAVPPMTLLSRPLLFSQPVGMAVPKPSLTPSK